MYKKFFEHRIRKSTNGYYCSLCDIFLTTIKDVESHCDSKNNCHNKIKQAQLNEYEDELKNFPDWKFKRLVVNEIVIDNFAVYSCYICNYVIRGLFNVFGHIKGHRHVFNKEHPKEVVRTTIHENITKEVGFSQNCLQSNKHFCKLCNIFVYGEKNFKEHKLGRNHRDKENLRLSKTNVLPTLKRGIKGSNHKLIVSSSNNTLGQSNPSSSSTCFTCFVCDSNFSLKEALVDHIHSVESVRNCKISSLLFLKELADGNLIYHCILCEVNVSYCSYNLVEHTQGKKHKVSVQNFKVKESNNLNILSKKVSKNENVSEVQKNLKCSYRCNICNVQVRGDFELLQHLKDLKHKHILLMLPRDYVPFIYCPVCKKDIFEDEKLIAHLVTVEHKNQLLNVLTHSQCENNLLESLPESKTIVNELCSEMIKKPRKENNNEEKQNRNTFHFDRGYSKKFLEIGPSNIFNVTQEKIDNLQLGVTSLLQIEEYQFCLICYLKIPNSSQLIFEHLFNVTHIHKLDALIESDHHFKNFPDQFSDFTLVKKFMKEVNSDVAFCFACNKEVSNVDNVIRKHVDSDANHLLKSRSQRRLNLKLFNIFLDQLNNSWYTVQRFSCQLCNKKFEYEIDFAEHLKTKKHTKKIVSEKSKVGFDICLPCASISVGTPDSYTMHCDDKMHKYLVKSKDYEVLEINKSAVNLLNDFEETSEHLIHQSDAATDSEEHIRTLSKSVEETVTSIYPRAKAYVFGSRASHLAFSDSDVDIFLDCGKKMFICTNMF